MNPNDNSIPTFAPSDHDTPFGAGAATFETQSAVSTTTQSQPPGTSIQPDGGAIVNAGGSSPTGNQDNSRTKILAALGVFLMLVGIGAGVFLVRRQQFTQSFAWECSLYGFNLDKNGTVTVLNGSGRSEPIQEARVLINGSLVDTFDVPALAPGEGATLGTVSIPSGGSYTWAIEGTKDCRNSGGVETYSAQCLNIKTFDEDWNPLSAADLAKLKAGDIVRFSVAGTTTQGTIDKARFSINNATPVETTSLRPGTQEFYYEYTIPAGVTSFSAKAQLFHKDAGWF